MDQLEYELKKLAQSLTQQRSALIILQAEDIIDAYPRQDLPDWVEILANGNPAELDAVIRTALDDMTAEAHDAG